MDSMHRFNQAAFTNKTYRIHVRLNAVLKLLIRHFHGIRAKSTSVFIFSLPMCYYQFKNIQFMQIAKTFKHETKFLNKKKKKNSIEHPNTQDDAIHLYTFLTYIHRNSFSPTTHYALRFRPKNQLSFPSTRSWHYKESNKIKQQN